MLLNPEYGAFQSILNDGHSSCRQITIQLKRTDDGSPAPEILGCNSSHRAPTRAKHLWDTGRGACTFRPRNCFSSSITICSIKGELDTSRSLDSNLDKVLTSSASCLVDGKSNVGFSHHISAQQSRASETPVWLHVSMAMQPGYTAAIKVPTLPD